MNAQVDLSGKTADQCDVTLWWVGEDRPLPGGGTIRADYISPLLGSLREAERALEELRADHPDAYIVRYTALFSPSSDSDMAERANLLAQLRQEGDTNKGITAPTQHEDAK